MEALGSHEYGKIPPQAKEFEEVVLGAIMLEDCISEVVQILKPDHFYVDAHAFIYSAMVRLFAESKPIDLLTVSEDLIKHGSLESSGGRFYIAQLTNKVGSSAHVEYHAKVIKEKWMQRSLIQFGSDVIKEGYEDTTDALELLDKAGTKLDAIIHEVNSGQSRDFLNVLERQISEIRTAAMKPDDQKFVLGLPTGIYSLDRKILGWTSPDLIIAAGRPAEGKTSFAIQSADTMLAKGHPVGFISAEMQLEQLNLKLLSLNTDIDISRLRTGKLRSEEWDKIYEAKKRMSKYEFKVFDKPCTPEVVKATFKTWKKKYGIEAGVVDYIQRLQVPKYMRGQSSDAVLTVVSNALKDTCLTLEIPIIALSQMGRDIESRTGDNARPKLTDLRGSGTLEQDADIVIFVYRPEIHGIKKYGDGTPTNGCVEFIVEKHRLGTLGTIKAKFIGSGNRFDDSDFSQYNMEYLPKDAGVQQTLAIPDDEPF